MLLSFVVLLSFEEVGGGRERRSGRACKLCDLVVAVFTINLTVYRVALFICIDVGTPVGLLI